MPGEPRDDGLPDVEREKLAAVARACEGLGYSAGDTANVVAFIAAHGGLDTFNEMRARARRERLPATPENVVAMSLLTRGQVGQG